MSKTESVLQNGQEAGGSMTATVRAFACHGTPLRGLMSTANSLTFEGRFGRMFPSSVIAANYGTTEQQSRDALKKLGSAMTSTFDKPKDGFDDEESGIPALYTYFGQFIDHDLTFDPVTTLTQRFDPNGLTDFRTPALDLDNVYGRGPDDQPYMYDGNRFILGAKLANGAPDLQRNSATPARAIIGDPRNDENSIVSQFQALMLRFHNRVVDENPGIDFPSLQNIVRWHYQWVIINDFLPRIISSSVLDKLRTNGQYDRTKVKFFQWKEKPFMPVEFSAAAYRLGHSMIRPGYRLNDHKLLAIFPVPVTVDGASDGEFSKEGLTGFTAMDKDRYIDWGRFVDVGPLRARGKEPEDKKPADDEMKKRLQFAYRLDASIVEPLADLPKSVAADDPPSLAQRNLLRGFELGLPSGQSVAQAMGITPLSDDQIFITKATDDPRKHEDSIAGNPAYAIFRGNCPLWTYILAEAAATATETDKKIPIPVLPDSDGKPITVTTPQLGEVGGRIVAEVFLGLLFGDKSSFLSACPGWTPSIGGVGSGFALRDIVAYALGDKAHAV
ncbi:uncharacterized protein HMPREF1541_07143 [Cyphellophora europaea CBS 101466]|uniref:Heme peroxidase n=1 Tax=Cyphellophora europaea (strain CBS 101466) TaxID=1220924 RepID=W2RLY7_CYPE1|nr:uncharacterized protein HMPREF1541_07143 [Cyphellophora europaea CBS 101466]ETN37521.1 hypothetical protein HMPREF1541_07143 [Cyphellophora europaea CBS 101466]